MFKIFFGISLYNLEVSSLYLGSLFTAIFCANWIYQYELFDFWVSQIASSEDCIYDFMLSFSLLSLVAHNHFDSNYF